jgi:selT/selW/selH-like putative selenoprotein
VAAELERELGVEPELIKGGGGIFEVKVDGQPVFVKRDVGRFPTKGEVPGLIRSR